MRILKDIQKSLATITMELPKILELIFKVSSLIKEVPKKSKLEIFPFIRNFCFLETFQLLIYKNSF